MGFEDLKAKLSGDSDEGYPVNEETIQEFTDLSTDEKKKLISEAKERGGKWRTSLLEIFGKSRAMVQAHKDALAARGEDSVLEKGKAKVGEAAAKASELATSAKEKAGEVGTKLAAGAKSAGEAIDDASPLVKYGAPSAIAAGLGAVALAKKMRASKKK